MIFALAAIPILFAAYFLTQLKKDTRAEAFLPPAHEAIAYREKVKEIFGLRDPVIVAIMNEGPQGVFNPRTLALVASLAERIAAVPGVDPDRITSLAGEKHIEGTTEGLKVAPFLAEPVVTQADAQRVREAVESMPLYLGSLVSRDGHATLIAVELLDPDAAESVYYALLELAEEADLGAQEAIHVAGEGALLGYLGTYIDRDARTLTPVGLVVVFLLLFLSFRTTLSLVVPGVVAATTLVVTLGSMAYFGRPVYFITNSLPVILIAISVADSIHILSLYYENLSLDPKAPRRVLVARTLAAVWKPILITSLTTIAGFMGVYLSSSSPPMEDFGLFAALGIAVALVASLTLVPCCLAIFPAKLSRVVQRGADAGSSEAIDAPGRFMVWLGKRIVAQPGLVLALSLALGVAGLIGLSKLETNDSDIDNFQADEPIVLAHHAINERFDGTSILNIVIEAAEPDGLLDPESLRKIEAFQAFLETLPHVNGTTSVVDYLKQMNQALNDGDPEAYALPDSADLAAQIFLLYSMSGDPTDFDEEIDYEYRQANLRVRMDSGLFQDEKVVIRAVERYIANEFNEAGLTAKISGHVAVHYYWMTELLSGHFMSVAFALLAVWAMAIFMFRSVFAGTLTMAPVALSVLLGYAIMGFSGIWLGIGTSMSAAITIGIGVDFAVHSVHRVSALLGERCERLEDALTAMIASTGRALLFNFLTVFCGFSVLVMSQSPGLIQFGLLIAVGVSASFLASVTTLPALMVLLRPAFLSRPRGEPVSRSVDERSGFVLQAERRQG